MAEDKIIIAGNEGLPTGPDVKDLLDKYGTPGYGVKIFYSDIYKLLQLDPTKEKDRNRFKTVTNAWRKRLEKEHNIVTRALRGEAFQVMNASERVKDVAAHLVSGGRKIRKGAIRSRKIPLKEMTARDRVYNEHYQKICALTLNTVAEFVPALPRPKLNMEQ